jgi:hypothetical protein
MKHRSFLAIAGLAAGILSASPANSAPVAGLNGAGDGSSLVIKVHGCHRSCEWGPYLRWHRHVGPGCRPVGCWPRAVYPHRCWIDGRGIRHCRW